MQNIVSSLELAAGLRSGEIRVDWDAIDLSHESTVTAGDAAWPEIMLHITRGDDIVVTVRCWACVAAWDDYRPGRHSSWDVRDGDGVSRGFRAPEIDTDYDEDDAAAEITITIRGGDNVGVDHPLGAGRDEATAEAARETIEEALRAAYDEALESYVEPSCVDICMHGDATAIYNLADHIDGLAGGRGAAQYAVVRYDWLGLTAYRAEWPDMIDADDDDCCESPREALDRIRGYIRDRLDELDADQLLGARHA